MNFSTLLYIPNFHNMNFFFFFFTARKNKIYSYQSYAEVFHLPANSLFLSKLLTCIYSSERNHVFVRQGVIVKIRNIKTEFLAFTVSYSTPAENACERCANAHFLLIEGFYVSECV